MREASGSEMRIQPRSGERSCLKTSGEGLLPKDVLHFHSQSTDQPRTVKLLLNAFRTEEIFGSHSSSARSQFVREDSLFKPGTCFDKDWSTCVALVLKTAFVHTGSLQSLPFSHQAPGASRTRRKLSE